MNEFDLMIGPASVPVPGSAQKLIAYLALVRQPVRRSRIAGQLWPDVSEFRALGNLRSSLWRLGRLSQRVVQPIDERLQLGTEVSVDLDELTELSEALIHHASDDLLERTVELVDAIDVLPDWDEEWLVIERERYREIRLHALERACEAMLERGSYAAAGHCVFPVVLAEPFRESARRLLILAHIRDGNSIEARQTFDAYCSLVAEELGISPPASIEAFLEGDGQIGEIALHHLG